MTDIQITRGKQAILRSKIIGHPFPVVAWYSMGVYINDYDQNFIMQVDGAQYTISLTVKKVDFNVVITCVLTNVVGNISHTSQLEVIYVPLIIRQMMNQTISLGRNTEVKFELEIDANPTATIFEWYYENKRITNDGHRYIINRSDNVYSLALRYQARISDHGTYKHFELKKMISGIFSLFEGFVPLELFIEGKETDRYSLNVNPVQINDQGTYKIIIWNTEGIIDSKAYLNVLYPPRFLNMGMPNQTILVGQDVNFELMVDGNPTPQAQWYLQGRLIDCSHERCTISHHNKMYKLRIKSVTQSDGSLYVIKFRNSEGEICHDIRLEVHEPPTIQQNLQPQTVTVGDELIYQVTVHGIPLPTVTFYRNNQKIQSEMIPGRDNEILAVFRMKPISRANHGDEYYALAENIYRKIKSNAVHVTVLEKPAFLMVPENQYIKNGHAARYDASIIGYPTPTVTWLFNGIKTSSSDSNFHITFDSQRLVASLTIYKANQSGYVECHLENKIGHISHTAKLTLLIAPQIIRPLTNETIKIGQHVTLSVEAIGNPGLTYQWYFDNKADKKSNWEMEQYDNVYILRIAYAFMTDDGTYEIVVNNSEGTTSSKAQVNVLYPPMILKGLKDQNVTINESVVFQIEVIGNPQVQSQWFYNDIALPHNDHILQLTKVHHTNQGFYKVIVSNSEGNASSQSKLNVLFPPQVITLSNNLTVNAGKDAILEITSIGNPTPTIEWFLNDLLIHKNDNTHYEMNRTGNIYLLKVKNVTIADEATYRIELRNKYGTSRREVKLTVSQSLRSLVLTSSTAYVSGSSPRLSTTSKLISLTIPPDALTKLTVSTMATPSFPSISRLITFTSDTNSAIDYSDIASSSTNESKTLIYLTTLSFSSQIPILTTLSTLPESVTIGLRTALMSKLTSSEATTTVNRFSHSLSMKKK
ncbi:unnamed protein product, partial [Didymodactylos carnosus]